jgi:hypothetical protein
MKKRIKFIKSSFCEDYKGCVGVRKAYGKILITNTNNENPIIEFTKNEWDAFIKGVKAGEFD